VDPDAGAAVRGRRRRALCEPAQGRARRDRPDLPPEDINIVVAGGETQGARKMFGGSLRNAVISIDA